MVIRVNFVQTELMVEICSESLVIAIGKVLLLKIWLEHQSKLIKVMKNDLCLETNSYFGGPHQ